MSSNDYKSIPYEIAFVALWFVVVCYGKTLKHMMASRCTSIRIFGCISCDRKPLDDTAAIEVVESPERVDISLPELRVGSITV
jgi:hypothetical protein